MQHQNFGGRRMKVLFLSLAALLWPSFAFLISPPDISIRSADASTRQNRSISRTARASRNDSIENDNITSAGSISSATAASMITREACRLLGLKSIGVDYGLVRTGCAVTVGYSPKPLDILSGLNNTEVCLRVVEMCRSEQAHQVVVGLPLHKNGTEAEQTNITRTFATELAGMVLRQVGPDCPVYLWDERYTSKEAAARLHSKDPNQDLYGVLDAEAACIILEHFYNDNGQGAELVAVSNTNYEIYIADWEKKRKLEEEKLRNVLADRTERLNWKKEAIKRDKEQEALLGTKGLDSGSKRKKKKRKRR